MNLLGETMYITWRGMGIIIDNFTETEENVSIYISVPKSSYRKNVTGIEMSGEFLAKRFKESLKNLVRNPTSFSWWDEWQGAMENKYLEI